MVSLGNDNRAHSFNTDAPPWFDETDEASLISSVLITDEEPNYKTIPIVSIIVIEILCAISLLVCAFLVPMRIDEDACFILSCAQVGFWCALFITSGYRNYHHNHIQRCGYLDFFRRSQLLQRVPLIVASLANALLVVILAIFQKYCSFPENCPSETPLQCHHYLQILFTVEVTIELLCMLRYLVIVIRFNKSKAIPDVNRDELLHTYIHSYAPSAEIGFKDEDYMEEILEKQADMIRYLRQHGSNLSRKIMKLNSQLEATHNPALGV